MTEQTVRDAFVRVLTLPWDSVNNKADYGARNAQGPITTNKGIAEQAVDRLFASGVLRDLISDAMALEYHPEFGSAWMPPDGELWKHTRATEERVKSEMLSVLNQVDSILSLLHHRGLVDSEANREDVAAALKQVQRYTR